ncbi:MAG TPA: HDIG domain-containing protein [Opitutaceae bacterium]|jgi:putative nucleotidyltransferase with HDIG domain|nr:HDIG domain-containing protein [Opitutaceae bacterium]HRE04274.1 HDIG domain-containing protein [Opitutaceae bacterium]
MALIRPFKLLRGGGGAPRRTRKTARVSEKVEYLETSRVVASLIFVATVAAIVLVSFVGVKTADLSLLPNQRAPVQIVANAPFSYESLEKTRIQGEQLRDRTPPVYRLEFEPLRQFEANIRELLAGLEKLEKESPGSLSKPASLTPVVDQFNEKGPYRVNVDHVAMLADVGDAAARYRLVENALVVLREIYAEGVHDGSVLGGQTENRVTVFRILKQSGEVAQRSVQSLEEAHTFLRINLAAEGMGKETHLALYRIFQNGLTPNLIYDRAATERLQGDALKALRPATVQVARGQTLVEQGARVSAEQYEMLQAHRKFLMENSNLEFNEGLQLFGRILLVLAMVLASLFYIRMEDNETVQSNSRLALLALTVVVNLALVRATYSMGSLPFFVENAAAGSLLPYLAPTALAPLIVAILINAGSAIFMALLISIFTGVIYGNRLDLLVLTFLASMVAIFASRSSRKRGRVVRAAVLGGLTVAGFALLFGVVDQLPVATVFKQMGAGLATGLLTGVVVVGLLPVLEGLFRRTTDITLLELTDFNHPLLRLMQLEAPGSYHHSLVVAQLAENAANAIEANPLLARVCALFHDIGKTTKPDYFTENQRDGINPHDDANPSLSALIIKAHVKDGVDLALKHKLPRAVIDVIQQHHGTTLIRYFFQRAVQDLARPSLPRGGTPDLRETTPRGDVARVCETTYRYDGPRPQFRESAIIHLADMCEAASRSMRKVTPQHLGELIEQIFRGSIADGQLDEAPLTLEELNKVKSSFNFTLLNMLHSRVAYPAQGASPALLSDRQAAT